MQDSYFSKFFVNPLSFDDCETPRLIVVLYPPRFR